MGWMLGCGGILALRTGFAGRLGGETLWPWDDSLVRADIVCILRYFGTLCFLWLCYRSKEQDCGDEGL